MKKKSKITSRSSRIPGVFDNISHKTERTAVAVLMHWMREIIKDNNIDLGLPDVETSAKDRKMPDLIIYESRRSQKALCVIEAKPPYFDVFEEQGLKEPARKKATFRSAKYFALTNFKKLTWYNTGRVNSLEPEEKQIIEKYDLSTIESLDEMEHTNQKISIKKELKTFLSRLYSVHVGREPEPKLPIDELLIFRIHEKIRVLSNHYGKIIRDACHKELKFAGKLKKWFLDQGWSFSWQPQDYAKVSRQTAYLLVNKILFYNLLQLKRPGELDPLEIPESLTKGALLQSHLQGYFNMVLKIDYETVYTTDFIDDIAFPDAKEVVKEIKQLIDILRRYDLSKLGFDIIGRIFERLIPQQERHNLGQYFTNSDVVDLILRFSVRHEDDKILDPSCGAGTFLVRAYQHKKLMNQGKGHEELLRNIWGNDIAKFPAHLATINLAINDLAVDENYPNILHEDFFTFMVGDEGFDPEKWRKSRAKTLGCLERDIIYPRWFDAVIGNPPYTRQEEIGEISPQDQEYKENIIENSLSFHGEKIADIGKRSGIYAYFFVHGSKFLKEGGYFGFIVPNSWLDVDYGKGLQEFFLRNYKIAAIIGSKVERWFEDADINTCIVILQKCKNKKDRDDNFTRFVYLKKPLRYFISPVQDIWEKQKERLDKIDDLIKTIFFHSELYENEDLRIYAKKQKELREEGFDPSKKKYTGTKWGIYLRSPTIVFEILLKLEKSFVKFSNLFNVEWGSIKTGADNYFYLDEKSLNEKKIEKRFVNQKVVRSPKDSKTIEISGNDLKTYLLVVDKDKKKLAGTNVLSYIIKGESKGLDTRPTCSSRTLWYDLSSALSKRANILWPGGFYNRFVVFWNAEKYISDRRLFNIYPKFDDEPLNKVYCAVLNSTLYSLFIEVYLKTVFGQGLLLADTYAVERMPLINLENLDKDTVSKILDIFGGLKNRAIGSIFEETGANSSDEVNLEKIRSDRRELDKIVMGEILGLSDDEQLEVYRAVVDMVKSRIEKAKSVGKKKKIIEGIDIDSLKNTIIESIDKKEE